MSGARPAAQVLVEALERYGVEYVFGNPGTTELPVLRAVGDGDLEYVLAPHEDVAVGMAAGYATVRRERIDARAGESGCVEPEAGESGAGRSEAGESEAGRSEASEPEASEPEADEPGDGADPLDRPPLGVVNLHLTAGVAHGLGNLYGAWMAGAPLLVTAGTHSLSFRHEEPILSGDLRRHVEPYTKYAAEVTDADALPTMLRRAVRTALTPPTGPVFLGLPMDVAETSTTATPERLGTIATAGAGDPDALDRAAERLAGAEEAVLLVGDGVARSGVAAVDAAATLADALGARVHGEALSAAVAFPREHDLWASVLPPSEAAIRDRLAADAIVLAGCSTNTTLCRHDEPLLAGDPTLVHLGADASDLGKRLPADVGVQGDPAALLGGLAERLAQRVPASVRRDRRAAAADAARAIRSDVRSRGQRSSDVAEAPDGDRPSAAQLVEAMETVVPDALVVDEGVGAKYALLARWDLEHGDFYSNAGGCLGYGLPATVGAALALDDRPDARPVVGFVGDGSYSFYPQSIRAAVRAGVDCTVVVPDNRGYGSVADTADDLFEAGSDAVPGLAFDDSVDLATNAESHGAVGHTVECYDDLEATLETATRREGVDVVDVFLRE